MTLSAARFFLWSIERPLRSKFGSNIGVGPISTVNSSIHFNGHFHGFVGFIGAKDDRSGAGDKNGSSYKTCKATVKSLPPTNQHTTIYRPDALPVAQPTVSKHWRESTVNMQTKNIFPFVCCPFKLRALPTLPAAGGGALNTELVSCAHADKSSRLEVKAKSCKIKAKRLTFEATANDLTLHGQNGFFTKLFETSNMDIVKCNVVRVRLAVNYPVYCWESVTINLLEQLTNLR